MKQVSCKIQRQVTDIILPCKLKKIFLSPFSRVYYCILDGADINRQFITLHFKDEMEAISNKFVAANITTGEPMVFLMDPKVSV